MKYQLIINKIVDNKILQKKEIEQQLIQQYYDLVDYLNQIAFFKLSSVYFKYNGKYFLFICDNFSFYYLGKQKLSNKFYFQLF